MDARKTPQSPGLPVDESPGIRPSTKASTRAGNSAIEVTDACALRDSAHSDPAQQAAVPVGDSSGSRSASPLQLERVPQCAWGRPRHPLALLRWLAELLTKLLTSCVDELEPWLKWKV